MWSAVQESSIPVVLLYNIMSWKLTKLTKFICCSSRYQEAKGLTLRYHVPHLFGVFGFVFFIMRSKSSVEGKFKEKVNREQALSKKKNHARCLFLYGLGNVFGSHIIWWKWKVLSYRGLNGKTSWKSKWQQLFLVLSSVNDSAPGTPAHVSHWSYGTSTSS